MTIAMTLLAREPTDTLEAQLRFHLAAGVEIVLVADPEIVPESFRTDERVRVVSGSLAAAAADGADWVVPAGPAEFWWPRGGSLDAILGRIPRDYDVVQALVRRFLRVEGAGDDLGARIYRLQPQAALEDHDRAARPERRIIHRGGVDVAGYDGGLVPSGLRPLRGWYPVEVLSFADEHVESQERIEAGLQEGVVEEDTRVRDALRRIAEGGSLEFERPSVVDNALFAVDASVLGEADAFRLRGELDELERRLANVEDNAALRVARKLQSLVQRSRRSR